MTVLKYTKLTSSLFTINNNNCSNKLYICVQLQKHRYGLFPQLGISAVVTAGSTRLSFWTFFGTWTTIFSNVINDLYVFEHVLSDDSFYMGFVTRWNLYVPRMDVAM